MQAESKRAVSAALSQAMQHLSERENALLLRRALRDFGALSNNDKWSVHCLLSSFFINAQTSHSLRASPSLSRIEAVCGYLIATPGLAAWWNHAKGVFSPGFVERLEAFRSDPASCRPADEVLPWLALEDDEECATRAARARSR